MKKLLQSIVTLLVGNAAGVGLASLILGPGFRLSVMSFLLAVVIFTAIEAAAKPLLEKAANRWVPQIIGSLSLLAVFVGLKVTQLLMPDMVISGISNWLAATLIVWLVSLIVQIFLPMFLFKAAKPAAAPATDATQA